MDYATEGCFLILGFFLFLFVGIGVSLSYGIWWLFGVSVWGVILTAWRFTIIASR